MIYGSKVRWTRAQRARPSKLARGEYTCAVLAFVLIIKP